ncbi:MAG: DNA-methyltransferase [Acidimicrobiales bacterium]
MAMTQKSRAPRNRTLELTASDIPGIEKRLVVLDRKASLEDITNKTIAQDMNAAAPFLPDQFVDLLIIDPPYNLNKTFNGNSFKEMDARDYVEWVDAWMRQLVRLLKPNASIYVCCDWKSSFAVYEALDKHFLVRNRITWEREKGRGSKTNWKNCSEDIWFATNSKDYKFYPDRVMLKRKVIAPYRTSDGRPKDWEESDQGNFRLTHPSNLWTDITIPFWSMPENTDHPTQKPEKLIAKLILASSDEGDMVLDPFVGSGTTSVVAKKLDRCYCGIEFDKEYSLLAEKRLKAADTDRSIQGYESGVFWERNSLSLQNGKKETLLEQGMLL